jgi:hypothetical protein
LVGDAKSVEFSVGEWICATKITLSTTHEDVRGPNPDAANFLRTR